MPSALHMIPLAAILSPLVPLGFLARYRRGVGLGYWVCMLAFLASLVADLGSMLLGGTWAFVPLYRTVQLGLFALVLLTPQAGELLGVIVLYAGVGTLLYYGMIQHRDEPAPYTAFMRWWVWYQGARMMAFGLFLRAATRHVSKRGERKPC